MTQIIELNTKVNCIKSYDNISSSHNRNGIAEATSFTRVRVLCINRVKLVNDSKYYLVPFIKERRCIYLQFAVN